jgi:D-3-phosphoglycerate dehydrogenase / 2-oxoglutarate reductase
MPKIVIADPLSAAGLALFRGAGAEVVELGDGGRDRLLELVADADALLVRSRTRVDAELLRAGRRLRVVGRAGIGVDNVDVPAATDRGILVVNAPTANLLSAAEHTFALLLALARNVSAADASIKSGEWTRSRFEGVELQGKTLGIVGLGRIGQQVAARARAFEMRVLAFDPYLAPEQGERLGADLVDLGTLLASADVVTLHVPFSEETRGLLDAGRLSGMKRGALLVNCSRGGVVDEAALLAALDGGHLGGAALDVFAEEPPRDLALARHPRVVATPHLGAQTAEAQERTSAETAEMVLAALGGSLAVTAVNLPFRPVGSRGEPFLQLAEPLGRLASELLAGRPTSLRIDLWGMEEALHAPVAAAVLKGVLAHADRGQGNGVNYVNVERRAAAEGIETVRTVHGPPDEYPHLIGVTLSGPGGEVELAGTLFRERQPRVVRFGSQPLEFRPQGTLLILRSWDLPGVVGNVGTLLGEAGVNIADVHLARKDGEEDAWTILRLDERPSDDVLARLAALPNLRRATLAEL